MGKKTVALAGIAVLTFIGGCSGGPGSVPPNSNTAQAQAPAPTIDAGQTPTATPTPTPTRASSAPLGGTITFPSGVKVSVSPPEVVPGGQYAFNAVEGNITLFTVTVTNEGTEPVNGFTMAYPRVTYGATGTEAQRANNDKFGAGTLSTILPGETQTVKVGFGIPQAELPSVRVELMGPSYSDFPAIFKG